MSQSRRSARLVSGGYYQSDDDSDSSVSTNISYRESPVKVFKKKLGPRRTTSRTSSRANSTASTASTASGVTETQSSAAQNTGAGPLPRASLKHQSTRVVPGPSPSPSPSPSDSPATAPTDPPSGPSQTPILGVTSPRSQSSSSGLHCASSTGGQGQGGVDSSGYSSAERLHQRSAAPAETSGSSCGGGGGGNNWSATWRSGANSAAAAAQTRIRNTFSALYKYCLSSAPLRNAGINASCSSTTACVPPGRKKHIFLLLLLLLLVMLLSVWYLFPLLASLLFLPSTPKTIIITTTTTTSSSSSSIVIPSSRQSLPPCPAPPVGSSSPPPLLPPSSSPLSPSSSPPPLHISMSASQVEFEVMEQKLERLLEELQLKQENLYTQVTESVRRDLLGLRTRVDGLHSEARARLEREVSGLSHQLSGLQTDAEADTARMQQRLEELERHRVETDTELRSLQRAPAPCPAMPTDSHQSQLTPDLQQALEKWLSERLKQEQEKLSVAGQESTRPIADKMADFALESQGASVISTRCSETYVTRSACVTLFGIPLWYPSESPRTVIQGHPVRLPGRCWAFQGARGTLVLSLSHPVSVTHITLDHLPRYLSPTGHIHSAPRGFQVYGMATDSEEGTLLGEYTYDQEGEETQTFPLHNPKEIVYRFAELRILSNWGQVEYTCVYRFRVHGRIASR